MRSAFAILTLLALASNSVAHSFRMFLPIDLTIKQFLTKTDYPRTRKYQQHDRREDIEPQLRLLPWKRGGLRQDM